MKKIKVKITAKKDIAKRYAVTFCGVKVAVAFSRDSGAFVGHNAIMTDGEIASGGSKKNWYCEVKTGSVFELEVDGEFFEKNKNRIKNWEVEEITDYSMTKERSNELERATKYLE